MVGLPVGVDGSDNGLGAAVDGWRGLVRWVPFCPEAFAMGVPRPTPDLHGGDGFAVLRGDARVLGGGLDLTAAMRAGADAMVRLAVTERVDFAILADASAACGSQVVHLGDRTSPSSRRILGVGVACAALLEAGIPVVSHRDHRTLGELRARIDPSFAPDPQASDHHDHPWVVANLRTS